LLLLSSLSQFCASPLHWLAKYLKNSMLKARFIVILATLHLSLDSASPYQVTFPNHATPNSFTVIHVTIYHDEVYVPIISH